jgi:hypothetical protein
MRPWTILRKYFNVFNMAALKTSGVGRTISSFTRLEFTDSSKF